jgi:hypothetical protein
MLRNVCYIYTDLIPIVIISCVYCRKFSSSSTLIDDVPIIAR